MFLIFITKDSEAWPPVHVLLKTLYYLFYPFENNNTFMEMNWFNCCIVATGNSTVSLNRFFLDPSLAGGDTLTCGDCKKDFKLQELTLFIQHKAQNACKKLKLQTNFTSDINDKVKSSSPKDRSYVSVGSPSVSGSGKKCVSPLWDHFNIHLLSGQTECDTNTSENNSASVKKENTDFKKHLFSDAQTNTVSSSG